MIVYLNICSWHDHDADEIQQHADQCIDLAIKSLEASGWAKESVKVIGASIRSITWLDWLDVACYHFRHHEPTWNYRCLESQDRKAPLQSHSMGRLPDQKHGRPFWTTAQNHRYTSLSRGMEKGAERNRYPTQHVCAPFLCPYVYGLKMTPVSLIALGFHYQPTSLL